MTHEEWEVALEAFLDGELPPAEAAAFAAETARDPGRATALERRRQLRALAREALGPLPAAGEAPVPRLRREPSRRLWWWTAGVAAAAVFALVALRTRPAMEGAREDAGLLPRPAGSQGLVAAPRLGEQAGRVMVLAPGRLVLPDGSF